MTDERALSESGVVDRANAAPSADDHPAASPEEARWVEERAELLELLAQQQRVAQAGLITGGLAHDVMNLVTGICGHASLALESNRPEDLRAALAKVDALAREIAETTRSLLSFVKRRTETETGAPVRLAECVASAERLVRALAKERGATLSVEIEGDPLVRGDARLVVQALVNLASNAAKAFPRRGGSIVLRAREIPFGGSEIEVEDDGPGIPEHLRARLFRPLVTGRAASGGHGLGLFIVRQVARRLRGSILLRTGPSGTSIRIRFPDGRAPVHPAAAAVIPAPAAVAPAPVGAAIPTHLKTPTE